MKLSPYSRIFPYKDGFILYSILTSASVLVDKDTLDRTLAGKNRPEEQKSLLELGIVTSDPERDRSVARSIIEARNKNSSTLRVVAAMNLDCNLACPYCFEKGVKGKDLYMSRETAGRLVDFITARLSRGIKTLAVDFYGGEPLLSLGLIKEIAARLQKECAGRGVNFGFSCTSNGTLLTPKTVEALLPLGFKSVRVTVNGPKEIHDSLRPFVGGAGSFETIMKNLKAAAGKVIIAVTGSYTKDNYRDYPPLLDQMKKEGLTPENVAMVRFEPVLAREGDCAGACADPDEPWVAEATIYLRNEVLKRGYKAQRTKPSICSAHFKNNLIINWDGGIYKCPGFLGNPLFQSGSLAEGPAAYTKKHALSAWKNKKCLACQYLPLCFGGCKYMRHFRTGDIKGIECRKDFLDAALEGMIKQEIRYPKRLI